jgi:anaerobic selenocysteine-containing dehydrogenase
VPPDLRLPTLPSRLRLADQPVPPGFTGTRLTACNLCEAICGLELTLEDGRVTGIRGNPDDPLSRGYICPKGVALADVYDDPDRLRRPVRRVGDEWVEISWDEALDRVADALASTLETHGRNSVGVYLGNPNAHALGSATHALPFVKSLGTRNRFSASSVDQIPHQLVAWQLYGHQLLLPIPDLDRTSYFLVFGANPMASNGSLMTTPDFPHRARGIKDRGGRIVVFDPRRTETAQIATEHHFVRPGSDVVVLLAMVHTLFADDLARPPSYADHVDRLRELVAPFTPELAEQVSGVPAADLVRITHEFVAAEGAAAYGRLGVSTTGFGSVSQWAINCLNLLGGHFDRPGGVLFPEPAVDVVGRRFIGRGHYDLYRSRVRGIPEYGGELPAACMREEIETPGDGQIRAFVAIAGNPVLSTPDGHRLGDAFDSLDFMAAIDIYLNETTRHADVILPPTTTLERDHYDLVFHGLAVRNTARFSSAVFAKPDGAMHDWEIYRELASRVAARRPTKPGLAARRARLKQRLRLGTSPTQQLAVLLRTGRTVSLSRLRRHPEGVDLGPLRPTMPGRLQTPEHRIDLAPALVVGDVDRLHRWLDDRPDDALVLIGRRHKQDNNSWFHNSTRLTRGKPRHQLLMHPQDLADRGIDDGALVTVTSRVGSVRVEVQATDDMMRGVASLPHGYGHQVDGTRLRNATKVAGVSINDLTDPDLLDLSGNAALNGVPVTVAAAPA